MFLQKNDDPYFQKMDLLKHSFVLTGSLFFAGGKIKKQEDEAMCHPSTEWIYLSSLSLTKYFIPMPTYG